MNLIDEKNLNIFLDKYIDKDEKILDVGCGVGNNLDLLMNKGYQNILGVDISMTMVEESRNKGYETYRIEELNELCLKDVNVLLFSHVLEHIAYPDIISMMEGYFSLCAKNAKVIIIMPILYDAFYNDIDHIKPYYPNGLMTLFSNNIVSKQYKSNYVLEIVDIEYRRSPLIPYNLKSRLIRTMYNKILYKIISIFAQLLQVISFGLLSKTTGYVSLFKLSQNK